MSTVEQVTRFKVGDRVYDTREEAEREARGQSLRDLLWAIRDERDERHGDLNTYDVMRAIRANPDAFIAAILRMKG